MKIITFNSLKGGVGKTTVLYAYSNELLKRGARVLIMDIDSQCNSSSLYSCEYNTDKNVYKMFVDKNIEDNIINVRHNLDIIPGSIKTSILSNELINQVQREQILFKTLRNSNVRENYDYILIDTHPDFSIVTQNALIISDMIISPVIPNQFSFQSIELLSTEWGKFAEEVDIGNSLILLPNNIKHNTSSSKDFIKVIDELTQKDEYNIFETKIPASEAFNKITLNNDVLENYQNVGKPLKAMKDLADEIEKYLS